MAESVFLLRCLKENENIDSKKIKLAELNGYKYTNSFNDDIFEIIVMSKQKYSIKEIKDFYYKFHRNTNIFDDATIYDYNWNTCNILNY